MKRYIKEMDRPVVTLDVIINVDYDFEDIAASKELYVNHPYSIKKSKALDEDKLLILNDIVVSILSVFTSHGFEILKRYQSKKSYSYYVLCDIDPQKKYNLPIVKIQFRISDHNDAGIDEDVVETSSVYIKSIKIGDEQYERPMKMMAAIIDMCDRLAEGDDSALYKSIGAR